jgi:hypothetical protein
MTKNYKALGDILPLKVLKYSPNSPTKFLKNMIDGYKLPSCLAIEAIHLAVSRVNCFDIRHFVLLFWLSVSAERLFSKYKVDFVYQCVIFLIFFLCQLIAMHHG